jgi:hypothetical protein
MKKNSMAICLVLVIGFLMSQSINAQTVGESGTSATQNVSLTVDGSALLAVVGGDVSMSLGGATQAGAAIASSSTDNTSRLRISSLVESGNFRKISGSISADLVGTTLSVNLIKPTNFQPTSANGGTSLGKVTLTKTDQNLVNNITTCWSGTNATDGYTIEYTYERITDAQVLASANIIVTYTISEEYSPIIE